MNINAEVMVEYPEKRRSNSHSSPSFNETSPLIQKTEPSHPANFDAALDSTGVGFFHFILVLVAGWALASDSVEVQ